MIHAGSSERACGFTSSCASGMPRRLGSEAQPKEAQSAHLRVWCGEGSRQVLTGQHTIGGMEMEDYLPF
jgi:hypothetical protein